MNDDTPSRNLLADVTRAPQLIRDGHFQHGLSLIAGLSSVLAGMEVSYEHYKSGFGQKIQWTPIVLSSAMTGAGIAGFFSRRMARTVLRATSILTLADSVVGFLFHLRGIGRKPGGWREPVNNIVMGPPVFAPLLFATPAYLGWIASYLRSERTARGPVRDGLTDALSDSIRDDHRMVREGRYQKHLAAATALSATFSGFEALYSHYKGNFRYQAQWIPVTVAPVLIAAALLSIVRPRAAKMLLPIAASAAVASGAAGSAYHARGIVQRPGSTKHLAYNVLYGPPIFAPLLFAGCGFIGLLAVLTRRERR